MHAFLDPLSLCLSGCTRERERERDIYIYGELVSTLTLNRTDEDSSRGGTVFVLPSGAGFAILGFLDLTGIGETPERENPDPPAMIRRVGTRNGDQTDEQTDAVNADTLPHLIAQAPGYTHV